MANLWDTLDDEQRQAVTRQAIAGSAKTPENMSRARQQLEANPKLVERLAKEAGIVEDDEVMQDARDVEQEMSAEDVVDASLADEGDVQETGTVTKTAPYGDSDIPPPAAGESIEKYIRRLSKNIGAV